jgi:hypothetical protein
MNKGLYEVEQVAATMAIENMPLSRSFINELIKVANGEKTSEELRQEMIKKHTRNASTEIGEKEEGRE